MKTRIAQIARRLSLKLEPLEPRLMLSVTTTALPDGDAFPFINGGVWAYNVKEKGVAETGTLNMASPDAADATIIQVGGTNSSTEVLTKNPTGIFMAELENSQGTITLGGGGAEFLPSTISTGESWKTNGTGTGDLSAGTVTGTFTSSGKATGWTKAVEPLGTYEAMEVTVTITFTGSGTLDGYPGSFTGTESETMYLVPGLGVAQGSIQASYTARAGAHSKSKNNLYTEALMGTSTKIPAPTGTDLTAQFGKITLPTTAVPGDKGNVSVIVGNQGETPADGSMQLDLYASTDGTVADGVLVTGGQLINQAVNLNDGDSTTYTFTNVKIPTVAPGTDFLVAVVNATESIPETNYANDTVAIPQSIDYSFGNVGKRKGVILNLVAADGTEASFALTGAGEGTISEGGSGWDLNVTGTTAASNVTITTSKATGTSSGQISLDDITLEGPLESFTATTTNLIDSLTADSTLGTLTLDNLTGDGTITIGGAATNLTTLTCNQVTDESLTSASDIKSLTAASWDNTGGADTITAPGITTATIKDGGLAADMDIGAGGIGTLTVTGGPISGNVQAAREGVVTVTGGGVSGSITSTATAAQLGKLTGIGTLTVTGGPISGDISAASIGTVTLTGGNLSGSISSTATAAQLGKLSAIGKVTDTGGDITGDLNALGNVGAISATINAKTGLGGNVNGGVLNFGGNLTSLTLSDWLENGELLVGGNITTVSVGAMQDFAVFAGVDTTGLGTTDGVLDLPTAKAGFTAHSEIGSFTVKGLKSGTTPINSFINSNIAAWQLGTVSVAYPDESAGFGVACTEYTTFSYTSTTGKKTTTHKSAETAIPTGGELTIILA